MDIRSTVLVLLCHQPRPAPTHRGLATALGPVLARHLEQRLLACALDDLGAWPGSRVLVVPTAELDWAGTAVDAEVQVFGDDSKSFGERVWRLGPLLRATGAERFLYFHSGLPDLDPKYLANAACALSGGATLIGQSTDGSIALLGIGRPWRECHDFRVIRAG